jgi:hypothetical protein
VSHQLDEDQLLDRYEALNTSLLQPRAITTELERGMTSATMLGSMAILTHGEGRHDGKILEAWIARRTPVTAW